MLGSRGIARWFDTADRLARHSHVSRETLVLFQGRALRRLVSHVCEAVPFYSDLYASCGVEPSAVRDIRDLDRLPVVTKEALRAAPITDTLAHGTKRESLVVQRTSGSTGRPFAIRRTVTEERLLYLFRLRALRQLGVRARDRTMVVREPPLGGQTMRLLGRLRQGLGVHRIERVNCFQPVEAIADQLDRAAASVICGYPGALAHVANYLIRVPRSGVRPKLTYTGGEPLHPHHRRRIEAGFGAPVFDTYGAHEFNLLAWECPDSGLLHVCEENVIVEVLRDGRPARDGEEGEVVVTGLHSLTMPFVRYLTRDIATQGPATCPCGQPFSTLRAVQGRTPHYLRLPDGQVVHPYQITGPLIEDHGDWIDQHQLVQEALDQVVLRVAPLYTPPDGSLEHLQSLGQHALGTQVNFRVELVTALRPEPSGKFQPYVSHLPSEPEDSVSTDTSLATAT